MARRSSSRKFVYLLFLLIVIFLLLGYYLHFNQLKVFHYQIHYAKVQGATIAYYTRGEGSPILLLPGFGMTMQNWDPLLLEKLSTTHMIIVFDYRGVGKSSGDISHLSEDHLVLDGIGLLDTLKIQQADVLGWSMGSFIGQGMAEQYPSRVRKLVLISTNAGGDQVVNPSDSVSTTIQNNLEGSWESVYVPLMFPATGKELMQAYLGRVQAAIARKEIPSDRGGQPTVRTSQEGALSDTDAENARSKGLSAIKSPTLIIAGQEDILIPVENDQRVADAIPGAKFLSIPNAGHAVLFQDTNQVSQLVLQFLAS